VTLAELRQAWTQRRDEWRRLGVHVDGARVAEEILEELEQLEAADGEELLTLTDAAREAAMHPDSFGRAIRQGRIKNAGRPNAPRVRRADLAALTPRGRTTSQFDTPNASLPRIARDAIAGKLPRVNRG
jgi:hypothetical protein